MCVYVVLMAHSAFTLGDEVACLTAYFCSVLETLIRVN